VPPVRRLIPWALVTILALGTVLTVGFTEAGKTPATLAALKAAQLSPSDLGNGWKMAQVKAATAPATGGLRTCLGSSTVDGPYSVAGFYKYISDDQTSPSSLEVLIMQPSAGAQAVFDLIGRCTRASRPVGSYRTSAFDGLAQASTGVIYPVDSGTDERSITGYFVQGDDFVSVVYGGSAPLSQVRQWAGDAVDKAAAST
jgi:hypothetical protein